MTRRILCMIQRLSIECIQRDSVTTYNSDDSLYDEAVTPIINGQISVIPIGATDMRLLC